MKDVSKRIAKVLSFMLVVALVLIMVQSYIPMKVSEETTDTLNDKKAMAANIENWLYRVDSYASRIGRKLPTSGKEEQKWLFYDTQNVYKNLYCIESGTSQAMVYDIYDLYSISDNEDMIKKYFKDRETYNHFMWILENMYLIECSDEGYMEDQLLKKMGDTSGVLRTMYNDMVAELQALYNKAGVNSTGNTEHFTTYHYNERTQKREASDTDTYSIDGRDNFIKTIQNYLLLSYAKQRSGDVGLSPLDENGNIMLNLRTYSNDMEAVSSEIGNDTASKKFVHQLLLYLVNGYNRKYNINKYKNFENDGYVNTKIDSSKVKYNSNTHRAGPFVLYNKYGFDISLTNVSYGSRVFNNKEYKIVDSFGSEVNLSNATDRTEFYVEIIADFSKNVTDTMKVNWNIDFGEVPDAKLMIPNIEANNQVLIDVERTHRTKTAGWGDVIPDLKADIALKKYIYSVNDVKVEDRLGSIDLTNLKENKTPHNATYNMNKTPITVNVGDKVTYAIRLFNEGEIAGTASKITDHLPNYLTFDKAYNSNGEVLAVEKTNYDKDITITTKLDKMRAFSKDETEESFKANSQVIYVDCTVNSNVTKQKTYTNIAEISEYTFEASSDIDSKPGDWTIGTSDRADDKWIDYTNNQDEWLDGGMHPFVGQEDDDDFDKIKVNQIDIALTKRIEGKIKEDGTEEYLVPEDSESNKSKVEISGYEDVKAGKKHDLKYNMNKKPAIVSRGDKLINVITVYNEGLIDGTVKEITDYLPIYLHFNAAETRKLNQNVEFSYNEDSRVLVIKINGDNGVSLKNLNEFENDVDKYEVKIVTDVTDDANGVIYNSAQITNYGYVGFDNEYHKADVPNVDIDSDSSTSSDAVKNKHISAYMAAEGAQFDLTDIEKDLMHLEDDDDVDAVKVVYNPEFDLALRKYIYKVEKDFKWTDGSKYTITYPERVPRLDEKSVAQLNSEQTAAYYHDKYKVNVEAGDLVTYRIRVYNEGTGEAYDGRATQVTDYLPEGVEFVGLESGYENEWKATANGQVITFDYIGDTIIEANTIPKMAAPHRGTLDYYQEIGLVCKVTAETNLSWKPLTNRAAITGDEAYENGKLVEGVTDRDSEPEELTNPELDTWYDQNVTNEEQPDPYYPGEQDDDDFDTIYVYNYKLDIYKTDGKYQIPGVDMKVMKYRSITVPIQNSKIEELSDLEDSIKENGEGSYSTSAPTLELENDVYIVKEVKTVDGYYNPFEGKYIKFSIKGGEDKVSLNYRKVNSESVYFEIYNDNGDDDYTNDTLVEYNSEDENSIYKYVEAKQATNRISILIKNTEIIPEGKYSVNLYKVNENGDLITGYSARFQGTRNNDKAIDVKTENGIATIDKDVEISSEDDHFKYEIEETEAPEGYERESRKLVLDVDFKRVDNTYVIDTEKTKLSFGFEEISKSEKDGEFVSNNGAAWFIDEETATINLYIKNTPITYGLKLVKTDGDKILPGVELKVLKYKTTSEAKSSKATELTELETSVKDNGEGRYNTVAPKSENDVYIIKEIKTVEGYYNPFEGKYIKFSVKRGKDGVEMNYRNIQASAIFFEIYEDNGDEDYTNDKLVDYNFRAPENIYDYVRYTPSNENEIAITIKNTPIVTSGKYTVDLHKYGLDYDGNMKEIEGVQFDASGKFNGGDIETIPSEGNKLETKIGGVKVLPSRFTNGYVDILPSAYDIADEIKLTEVGINDSAVDTDGNKAIEKYSLGLEGKEISIKVNKKNEVTGNKVYYYVDSLEVSVDGKALTANNGVFVYEEESGAKVQVSLIKNADSSNIDIRVWNPESPRKYNLKLRKTDGTNTLPGVELKVVKYTNSSAKSSEKTELTELETAVKDNGEGAYSTVVPKSESDSDVYIVKEIKTVDGYYNPFEGKYIKFTVKRDKDGVKLDYRNVRAQAVFVDIYEDNGDDDYANDKLIDYNFRDQNSIYNYVKYNPTKGNDISIVIENKPVESSGKYTIDLHKYGVDRDGNMKEIEGVQFDATGKFNGGEAEAIPSEGNKLETKIGGVKVLPSRYTDGYVNIDASACNTPDEIKLTETGIKEGAVDSDGDSVEGKYTLGFEGKEINITVNKKFNEEGSKIYYYVDSLEVSVGEAKLESKDGIFVFEKDNGAKVQVSLIKNADSSTIDIRVWNPAAEVKPNTFNVKLYKVDENGYLIKDYTAKFEGKRYSGIIDIKDIRVSTLNGVAVIDEDVEINNVNDSYKYMINETEAPVGFKKVEESLVLTTKFKEENNILVIDPETTELSFGSETVAQSSKDNLFKNNSTAAWFIDNSTETATINIYLKNTRDSRTFKLNLVKRKDIDKDENGEKDPLAGAEFKITIDDGKGNVVTKEGLTTDKNGRIPTISGIAIGDDTTTYTVTVEETKTPEGYIGIEGPVTFTAKSTIKDNVYVLEPVEMSRLENEARVSREIKADEIYIEAENRAVPVIHKGVKTVENQNSGYDKNEIQTWVINTTVPYGIKDYTKYVVTDTIDYLKSKVEEKRIEFINEDKPEENVVVKYKGTDTVLEEGKDYYVFFDKETKVLVVTFINNDFQGGKSLTEGTKLEITFKTKFTLDENGNIKGLNQTIPNTSHLTYGVNGKEDTAKSETPEVHTGGVGVFKYDEVSGKALEGAHFKIARSEEDARNGKFIKLRDENGNETEEDYEVISDANGHAEFVGLEFGEDAEGKVEMSNGLYTYDWTKAATTYYIVETEAPEEYNKITDVVPAVVTPSNYNNLDLTKYIEVGNRPKEYDLALRKYITNVKAYDHDGNVIDRNITDREPRVTLTDEFKDKNNKDVTTAIYEHTKEPVIVQQDNIVTYNIRVYNEGPEDAYASIVKDDIPEGTEFVPYTEGDGSINDKYDWELLDADGNKTSDVTKAKYITTRCLASGEENLIKAFDPDTMNELDCRTVQVQFKVTEPNTSERILTNYAQISEITNAKGKVVTDRDSTPGEWIEGEDDQDIENIKLLYFDLALRKWVTKAIVIENGQEAVFETGHKAEDNPEDVVKVDLKKSKINKVVVKFEYQIRVTNQGKIGGYALQVTDHIPEGLTFDEADNTIWTKVDDNTIVTDALKDVYLEPGESAEVTVVLRWINSASNLGVKVNVAEISKDYNEYGVADIDSTPGNYKWGEDDIDDAPVMLSTKTGSIVTPCVALGVGVLFILVFGIKGIKKSFKEI